MQENIIIDDYENNDNYQILVVGIKWNKNETVGKYRSKKDFSDKLPEQIVLDLPENIREKENADNFYDLVETWVYNFLAKRFNHIAYYCQIWLPLKKQTSAA